MAIEHTLTDMDSLPSLALQYFGDAARWKEIADYNKLDYPYVVTDKALLKDFFGSGYLTVIRANFQNDAAIKAGWKFKTPASNITGNIPKLFEVSEDTIIPAGISKWYIQLRCTLPGTYGNVAEYTVTEVPKETVALSGIQFIEVYNESAFTGGKNLSILTTGDTIYIPTDSTEVIPENVSKILELIGGTDLILDSNGDLVFDPSGDLASVTGADNIRYAVVHRIETEMGEMTYHPEYGSELQELVGNANMANREKLAQVAVLRALDSEDRITEGAVDSLSIDGTTVNLSISYKIAITNTKESLSITI